MSLRIAAGGLEIVGADGGSIARWPLAEVRVLDLLSRDRALRLSSRAAPAARITVEGSAEIARLRTMAPELIRRPRRRGLVQALGWAGLAVALGVGFYFALPRLVEPVAALIPKAWEERFGDLVLAELLDSMPSLSRTRPYCVAPAGVAALEGLGARLARAAGTGRDFRLGVINHGQVNAFALPGGRILIMRGLIRAAKAPQEVAGVLAHEMAHVIERHPTESLLRRLGLAAVLSALFGDSSLIASTGGLLTALAYSRADEAQADAVGLSLLVKAGIRADGLATLFARLEPPGDGDDIAIPRWLSTHPPSAARRQAAAAAGTAGDDGLDADEWRALTLICARTGAIE